jgi:hypothetical protein
MVDLLQSRGGPGTGFSILLLFAINLDFFNFNSKIKFQMKNAISIIFLILFLMPLNAQTKSKFTQEQLRKALVKDKILECAGLVNIAVGSVLIGLAVKDFNSPVYSTNSYGQPVKNDIFAGTDEFLIGCLFAASGIPVFITGAVKKHNVEVELKRLNFPVSSSMVVVTLRF